MTSIIKDIAQARTFLGKAISTSTNLSSMQPFFREAEETELTRALGSDFVSELRGMNVTSENEAMFQIIRNAVAWYGYLKYLPFSIGQDGDFGLTESSNDGSKPVRIGVLDKRIRESGENASNAMERVLKWAFENRASYESLDEYLTERDCPWFESATQLTKFLPMVNNSYRLFVTLSPYMQSTEDEVITPLLESEFSELRAKVAAGISLTEQEQAMVKLVRYTLATTTYARAIRYLNIVLDSNGGLRILSDFDGIYNRKSVDLRTLGEMISHAENEAGKWEAKLRKKLQKKPTGGLPDNSKYEGFIRLK